MRPKSTSCWSPKTCRIDNSVERRLGNLRSLEGVSRRAASARQDRRGVHAAAGEPDRLRPRRCGRKSRTCRCCAAPNARCASSARWRRPARGRSMPAPFFAPPADTEFARRWRARAAALDGPTALNEVEFEGAAARLRHPAAAGAARADRRRSCGGRAGDRLPGRAQGGIGGAAAQERRWPRAASISTTPTPCGKPPPRSPAAQAAAARRSTVCWSRSRSPAAPRSCSACSATSRWDRSSCSAWAASWSSCSRT